MKDAVGPYLSADSASNCSSVSKNSTINATAEPIYPAEYYDPIYRVVGSLLVGLIFVVGLVGNALVVAVVTRTRSMHTPTNWYLVSLALADVILLVSAPLPTLVEYHLLIDEWVFGRVGCSAMVFMQYLGVNLSSLSITAFTVERYLSLILNRVTVKHVKHRLRAFFVLRYNNNNNNNNNNNTKCI